MPAPIDPWQLQPCANAWTLYVLANKSPETYSTGTAIPPASQWRQTPDSITCGARSRRVELLLRNGGCGQHPGGIMFRAALGVRDARLEADRQRAGQGVECP